MSEAKSLPKLIIITGRPGAGKTTLAHRLAQSIRCPALVRDELKEGYVNTTDQSDDDANRHIYHAFFDAIHLLLTRNITLIAEAAFQHKLWAPKLEPIRPICRPIIILCHLDPALARDRHVERGLADPDRERFHADHAVRAAREGLELPLGQYDPPHFDDIPTLTVNTTADYQPPFDSLVSFARTA